MADGLPREYLTGQGVGLGLYISKQIVETAGRRNHG
jgi:signal transduction histidine kinase